MSIPIDIPGGHHLGELSGPVADAQGGPVMQPGVQQSEEGGFRGIVLIGASPQRRRSRSLPMSARCCARPANWPMPMLWRLSPDRASESFDPCEPFFR